MSPNKALLATLLYSDMFDFPLTLEELYRYVLYRTLSKETIKKILQEMKATIYLKDGYYFLAGRESIVDARKERRHYTKEKIQIVKNIVNKLSKIPTIMLIGLSGSVAMNNAKKKDDIDVFIITKSDSVWITRLLVVCLLFLVGKKRKRIVVSEANTICANMFVDVNSLSFDADQHNLYLAQEIVHMQPLFVRNSMDEIFLQQNSWVKKFLPHTMVSCKKFGYFKKRIGIIPMIERVAKTIQLLYMRKHITSEIVTDHILSFHPENKEHMILAMFEKRKKAYEI